MESAPSALCTHSRLAASPSPLPVLARAATTQATSPTAITIRAPRGGPVVLCGGSLGGVAHSATVLEFGHRFAALRYLDRLRGYVLPVAGKVTRLNRAEAEAADGRRPRAADQLHRSRLRAGSAADPRHGRDLRQLGIGDRAAGDQPHGDRAGLPRPRLLGARRRRLLARRPRQRPPRPDADARPRAGDAGRPLARRRRRDAVHLPVPGDGRAAGAGLQRRPRPRRQPDPAGGGAARRRALHLGDRRRRQPDRLRRRPRPRPRRPAPQRRRRRSHPRLRDPRPTPTVARPSSPPSARSSAWRASASPPSTSSTSPTPCRSSSSGARTTRSSRSTTAARPTPQLPGSRLEIFEDTGHVPQLERPGRFIAVLERFLAETEPAEFDRDEWQAQVQGRRELGLSTLWTQGPQSRHGKDAPDRIRTCGLFLRREALYPAELRALGTELSPSPNFGYL